MTHRKKYPCRDPYLLFYPADGETIRLVHFQTRRSLLINASDARFLQMLDGRTDPVKISLRGAEGEHPRRLTAREARALLGEFHREGLLAGKKRFRFLGPGAAVVSLGYPSLTSGQKKLSALWNRLLMLLWLPALALGLWTLMTHGWQQVGLHRGALALGAAGLILGRILMELSHGAACESHGGHWFETVLTFRFLIPGISAVTEEEGAKTSFQKLTIRTAGVRACLLLSGIFLMLLRTGVINSRGLILAAALNAALAATKLVISVVFRTETGDERRKYAMMIGDRSSVGP